MEKDLELRVSELEKMLFLSKNVLSFDEASRFLNLSKSYLYKLTSGNLTQAQIEQEAQKYILNRPLKK